MKIRFNLAMLFSGMLLNLFRHEQIESTKNMIARLVVLLVAISFTFGCTKVKKPNVVIFLVDDLGWTDLSSYGSDLYQTPNVDKLVAAGVKFTNAYASCTVCSPTRASIMTGKYPANINCTDWISGHKRPFAQFQVPDWTQHIQDYDVTIAEALKKTGYNTIHIGKWHLGEDEKYWPEYHGFDQNIGGWKMGMPKRVKKVGGYFTPYHNPRLTDGPEREYLTERLANEAVEYIKNNDQEPFFLNFWLYNVHTPLQAREEKVARYDTLVNSGMRHFNSTYAAMVEHMDDALGAVVNQLKSSGVYENTIIVFASDNGGLIGNNGNRTKKPTVTSNYPLRSGKGDRYEGGVRTPLVISWPAKIKPANESDVLAISMDIFPTILGLLGQTKDLPEKVDGVDLSAYLTNGKMPGRDALFWHYPHYHTEGATPYSAVRKGDWKLIRSYESDSLELFNLKDDVSESINLISEYPDKSKELETLLTNWKNEVGAQEPIPNPDYNPEKEGMWKSH